MYQTLAVYLVLLVELVELALKKRLTHSGPHDLCMSPSTRQEWADELTWHQEASIVFQETSKYYRFSSFCTDLMPGPFLGKNSTKVVQGTWCEGRRPGFLL